MLVITGLSMLIPTVISWSFSEPDLSGHLQSMIICIVVGIPFWLITRRSRALNSKDGFAIVSFAWLIVAFAGSLPFYLSGTIKFH